MRRGVNPAVVGSLIGTLSIGTSALAQSTGTTDENGVALEEVIVSAQRRVENVQDVPISVDRIGAEQLSNARITQAVDLSKVVAGLITNNATSDSTPIFAIRGIGLDDGNVNNSSGVGLYVDEVYQSSPVFLIAPFFDVDHVEVLKGPQGTLYGRNTTGGAISVISRAPTDTPDGYVTVGYGRWQTVDLEGAFGGPITDSLRGRIAGTITHQGDGWQTDIDTGKEFGLTRRGALRAQLAATLPKDVELLFNYHYAADRSKPQSPTSPNAESAINSIYGVIPDVDDYFGTPIQGALDSGSDPAKVRVGPISTSIDSTTNGGSIRVTADLPGMQLVSVTAYDTNSTTGLDNYDGIPVAEFNYYRDADARQFSEEIRLTSTTDGRVEWVAGAVYGTDRVEVGDRGDASFVVLGTFDPQPGPVQLAADYVQDTTSYGLFANSQIHLTPDLNGTLGLRYTHDERSFDGATYDLSGLYTGGPPGTPTAVLDESHTTENVSYRVGLDYHFSGDAMVYGSYSTGYKAGGYYGAVAATQEAWGYVDPEEVATAELGLKSQWWNDRGQFNAAVFHTQYTDRQSAVTVVTPTGLFVTSLGNVPRSEIDGAEIETKWVLGAGFDVRASATYLSSSITRTITNVRGLPLAIPLQKGSELAHAPEWSTYFSVGYKPAAQIGNYTVEARADYSWASSEVAYIGDPQAEYGPNRSLGAHIELARDDGRISWTAWGSNLTGSRDITYSFTDILSERVVYRQKPLAYGLRFTWSM